MRTYKVGVGVDQGEPLLMVGEVVRVSYSYYDGYYDCITPLDYIAEVTSSGTRIFNGSLKMKRICKVSEYFECPYEGNWYS
jgi:hypothetical protein